MSITDSDLAVSGRGLYRLDASLHVEAAHSRAIADIGEHDWSQAHGEQLTIRRHVGIDPISATAWATAMFMGRRPPDARAEEENAALARARTLIDQPLQAVARLFAVPPYDFGVSQHFKAWVDTVITDPRTGAGAAPVLPDKPGRVTVRGGSHRAGTPRAGWDRATGWMRRILAGVWGLTLTVVQTEFTVVGLNPALDQFTELARQRRDEAEREGYLAGRALSEALLDAGVPGPDEPRGSAGSEAEGP